MVFVFRLHELWVCNICFAARFLGLNSGVQWDLANISNRNEGTICWVQSIYVVLDSVWQPELGNYSALSSTKA